MAQEAEMGETRTYKLHGHTLVSCHAQDDDVAEPDAISDRRQRGRLGYEYEVRWRQTRSDIRSGNISTTWVARWQLAAMGHIGMAKREDARQAVLYSLGGWHWIGWAEIP